jgi:hypothetical protein
MRPARQRMRCRHGYRVMLAPSDQTYHRPDLDYREQPTGQWVDYHKWQPARPTVTFIGTVAIGFTLYELTEHVDVRYVNGQYVRVDHAPRTRRSHRRILKAAGLPPVPHRPTSWQTFLKAHWGVIAGADFFTIEVWTWRGLVTCYTVFIIELASRRVHVLGSTPRPSELLWGKSSG